MSWIASLDMGSEKMVMAVAEKQANGDSRLSEIRIVASQGVKNGMITDKQKAKTCIQYLIREAAKGQMIDALHVSLSGDALMMTEHCVNTPFPKVKTIDWNDVVKAEKRCAEMVLSKDEELVELIPVSYAVDRKRVNDPVGMAGKRLDIYYRVYLAEYNYLAELRNMFAGLGIENVNFFPVADAMQAALVTETDANFAVVDLGASSTSVSVMKNGRIVFEEQLPLGVRTVDSDIMSAFSVDASKARKLKHENGAALRYNCKNTKVVIPDTKLSIESRDLAFVIQCRMEELLEGAVYQLQQCGNMEETGGTILLTGGGSRLADVDILLGRLSGHRVRRAKAKGVRTEKEDTLRMPEYLIALGLLSCEHEEAEVKDESSIGRFFKSFFK